MRFKSSHIVLGTINFHHLLQVWYCTNVFTSYKAIKKRVESPVSDHLTEVVACKREVSLIAIWLTEEPIGILVRWSLMRGGRSGRLHCKIITHKNSITITVPLAHVACFYTQQKYSFSKYSWFVLQIPIIRTTWPLANWDSCFPNNSTKNVEWTDARKAVPQVPSFASTQMVLVELSQTQDYKLTMMLSCACPLGNFSFTEDENKIQISGPFAEKLLSRRFARVACCKESWEIK